MTKSTNTTIATDGPDLRERREALRLSRVRLATLAGFSPAHLGQIEDGYIPRRGDAVERIDSVLAEYEVQAGVIDRK